MGTFTLVFPRKRYKYWLLSLSVLAAYHKLGSKIEIPCLALDGQVIFKWSYSYLKNALVKTIVKRDKNGVLHYSNGFRESKQTLNNFSLVINNFNEVDEGTYFCEVCENERKCIAGIPTSLYLQPGAMDLLSFELGYTNVLLKMRHVNVRSSVITCQLKQQVNKL